MLLAFLLPGLLASRSAHAHVLNRAADEEWCKNRPKNKVRASESTGVGCGNSIYPNTSSVSPSPSLQTTRQLDQITDYAVLADETITVDYFVHIISPSDKPEDGYLSVGNRNACIGLALWYCS
jgi:hypothetical protein